MIRSYEINTMINDEHHIVRFEFDSYHNVLIRNVIERLNCYNFKVIKVKRRKFWFNSKEKVFDLKKDIRSNPPKLVEVNDRLDQKSSLHRRLQGVLETYDEYQRKKKHIKE